MTSHDTYTLEILGRIATDAEISQRSIARSLGIALGLTNLIVCRLVRNGWVRLVRIKPNRVRYLLTPTGVAAKARIARARLQSTIHWYAEARARVSESLAALSGDRPGNGRGSTPKRIVFYGTGDVAEIGYVCLQETDLQLVGVVDSQRRRFFGMPVHPASELRGRKLNGVTFDLLVVMSFDNVDSTAAALRAAHVPSSRVQWI